MLHPMTDAKQDPQKLLEEIETFLVGAGMNPSDFGTLSKNDSGLVFRLRQGKDVRTATASELRRFMENYRRPLARARPERRAAHA